MGSLSRIAGFFSIYKRGQGKWSRGLAAFGLLALGTYGAVQTSDWMIGQRYQGTWELFGFTIPYYHGIGLYVPALIFLIFAALTVYVCNVSKPANLLIETEVEMRKVTWPTTTEVMGATVVVVVVVLILGFYLILWDLVFTKTLLKWLGAVPSS